MKNQLNKIYNQANIALSKEEVLELATSPAIPQWILDDLVSDLLDGDNLRTLKATFREYIKGMELSL